MSFPITICHLPLYFYSIVFFRAMVLSPYLPPSPGPTCSPRSPCAPRPGWKYASTRTSWIFGYWTFSHLASLIININCDLPNAIAFPPHSSHTHQTRYSWCPQCRIRWIYWQTRISLFLFFPMPILSQLPWLCRRSCHWPQCSTLRVKLLLLFWRLIRIQ